MKRVFLYTFLLLLSFTSVIGQTCPSSQNSWEWPTHTNWFSGKGQMMNFGASGTGAGTVSAKVGPGTPFTAYESCASASDEDGNLVIFTNGVKLWDGTGSEVAVPGGLKTGAENAGGNAGSAVQGVFITKHPLNTTEYYIFTTDDAIGGAQNGITNGFNYFVYNKATNTCSGATRLGNYRTTEQVAGTFHKNGLDIWIVTHEAVLNTVSKRYNAYLLKCDGLTTTPVVSDVGFDVIANTTYVDWQGATQNSNEFSNERASIEFAPNAALNTTIKSASTFHCGTGTWDPVNSVSLMDFNTLTGQFSNAVGLGDGSVGHSNPYDCEFSADGSKLYVTFQADPWSGPLFGRLGVFTVPGGVYTEIGNSGSGSITTGSVKLGGNGTIYTAQFQSTGWAYLNNFVTSNGSTANFSGLASAGAATVGYGLPNMFIPPSDSVIIQAPPTLTTCDVPYNFSTLWKCKGTSAENTPLYENAYEIITKPAAATATIDAVTGVFNTDLDGAYRIVFTICTITDTLDFNIGTCGCDVEVKHDTVQICAGEAVMLDSLYVSSSDIGTWALEEIAPAPGSNDFGVLDDTGADTTWTTTTNTRKGLYMFVFTVTNGGCKDTTYINVNPIPVPSIETLGPLCIDANAVVMQGSPQIGADTTGVWKINNIVNAGGSFDPAALGKGLHTVNYEVTINGCTANVDSVFRVNALPVVTVNDSTICAGAASALFTATSDTTGASWLWSGQGSATTVTESGTTAGSYIVQVTDVNGCISSGTGTLTVTPLPTPAITAMGPYCAEDNAVAMAGTPTAASGATVSWKINDVVNAAGSFDPGTATVGNNTVRYITTVSSCTDSVDITVVVNAMKDATISDSLINACVFDPNPTVTVAEGGGIWSNAAVTMVGTTATIDLATLGSVTNEVITYTLGAPCGDVDQIVVTTTSAIPATINQVGPYCSNDTVTKTITSVNPGGTWHGTGILNTNTGTFRASTAGAGTHTIEYRIAGNCGDTSTIDIVVNPASDATINTADTKLCEYDNPITITTAFPNGTWREINNTNGAFNAATGEFDPKRVGTGGIFQLEYGFAGPCPDLDTIEIEVVDTAVIIITGIGPFCDDAPAQNITVTPAGGTWSGNGVNAAGLFTPAAGLVATSPNVLTYSTSTNGECPVTDTIHAIVNAVPDATLNTLPGRCVGESAVNVIPADLGGTFSNATCAGCLTTNAATGFGSFSPDVAGTHIINYSITVNGCTATDATSIVVSPPVTVSIAPVQAICQGSTTPITITATVTPAGSVGTGVWGGDLTGPVFDPTGAPASPINGTYSYTAANCPVQIASVTIDVLEVPTVVISAPSDCVPLTTTFTDATVAPFQGTLLSSAWNFGNGLSASTVGSATTVYDVAATYSATLTNTYSYTGTTTTCSATGTNDVVAHPLPLAEFEYGPQPASVLSPTITFTSLSNNADTYDWNFSAKGIPDSGSSVFESVTFNSEDDDTIDVQLIVESRFGCTDTIVKPVIIQGIFTVYVPNAFTPGGRGDGLNDTFYPQGQNWATEDYEFYVLDRWGNLVFKSTTIGQGWDGRVDNTFFKGGDVAQQDVYVWKLQVKNRYTGKKYKKVGTVTLVK